MVCGTGTGGINVAKMTVNFDVILHTLKYALGHKHTPGDPGYDIAP